MKRVLGISLAIALVILTIVGIYIAYFWFLYSGFSTEAEVNNSFIGVRAGTFGDAFGTLNALFSGLAFTGVMITVLLQRKDLRDGQAESVRQQVESQFYNMLRLQQEVVNGFDLQKTHYQTVSNQSVQIVTQGRDCFKSWAKIMEREYSKATSTTQENKIREAYRELWDKHRGDLSLYFRSLYSLFRFLSESNHINKKWLGNVARSLLSDYELVVLFYNCLMPNGQRFQKYATEFSVFDNLDIVLLLNPKDVLLIP
ncbi:hypothetical protein GIV45_24200, partial [Pseudomonas syringae]